MIFQQYTKQCSFLYSIYSCILKTYLKQSRNKNSGFVQHCADEGTRTHTLHQNKILSLARLPISPHPRSQYFRAANIHIFFVNELLIPDDILNMEDI